MTLEEAITHCEEVVAKYEKQAANSMSKEGKEYNCECAADHRQLAEWLRDLKEAKRLLKQAVSVMNNGACTANCYNCKHKGNCDYSQRFEWEHTDEVEKLLKQ